MDVSHSSSRLLPCLSREHASLKGKKLFATRFLFYFKRLVAILCIYIYHIQPFLSNSTGSRLPSFAVRRSSSAAIISSDGLKANKDIPNLLAADRFRGML